MSKINSTPSVEGVKDAQIEALMLELEEQRKENELLKAQSSLSASDIIVIEVEKQKYQLMTNNISWKNPKTNSMEFVEYDELIKRTDIHQYLVANNSMVKAL
jgi:hypothetical protein